MFPFESRSMGIILTSKIDGSFLYEAMVLQVNCLWLSRVW